jgi:hypothetical protein
MPADFGHTFAPSLSVLKIPHGCCVPGLPQWHTLNLDDTVQDSLTAWPLATRWRGAELPAFAGGDRATKRNPESEGADLTSTDTSRRTKSGNKVFMAGNSGRTDAEIAPTESICSN